MKNLYLFNVDKKLDILIPTEELVIGRGSILLCEDNRISRQHGIIKVPKDHPDTIHITSTHTNPIFYKSLEDEVSILTKDLTISLKDGDKFSLLPDEYWYEIKFKSAEEANNNHVNGTGDLPVLRIRTVEELSTIANNTRVLPSWLSADTADAGTSEKRKLSVESDSSLNKRNRTFENGQQPPLHVPIIESNMPEPETSDIPEQALAMENNEAVASSTNEALPSTSSPTDAPEATATSETVQIKEEKDADVASSSNCIKTSDSPTSIKKEVADSSLREMCKFGIKCYRRNLEHRTECSHPGDHDYRRPTFPPAPIDSPMCPYGTSCYRRNPQHFQEFRHPDSTSFTQNAPKPRRTPKPMRAQNQYIDYASSEDDDDWDMELDDDSDNYLPTNTDDDDDDDDDFEPPNTNELEE